MLQAGRLPPANIPYIDRILLDPDWLPKPREVAERVGLSYEQRQRYKLWTIPPVDVTKEQLAEKRREKDRQRKKLKRDRNRAAYRAAVASNKPWLKAGLKKSTYYYRIAKGKWSGRTQSKGVRTHPLPAPLGRVLINR